VPNITPADAHVMVPLTQIMVAYAQQTKDFIADKVFPVVPVQHISDFYYRYGRRAFLQTQAAIRAPGTESVGVEWEFTKNSFTTQVWALHHDIEDQLRSNADANFQLDTTGTELITQQMLLRRDLQWISQYFISGAWGETLTGTSSSSPSASQFTQFDVAGSTPIEVFRAAKLRFKRRTGMMPNVAVFSANAYNSLLDHPEIIERIKYTQTGIVTQQLVAAMLDIDTVLVASAVQATNLDEELVADTAPTTQWITGASATADANGVLLVYAAPRPSRNTPSAGYTFAWNGYLGASSWGGRIKKFRMEHIASDRIEIETAFVCQIVAPELGTFLSGCVANPIS
jgi:Phage major capsid protein E